jgi:NTP pyrophosphatase (non-canonical NTP hydrolase)
MKSFTERVAEELKRARDGHEPIHSAHEGYAVILEELDEVKEEVWKKRKNRDLKKLRDELVQVAATAQRMCEDLNLL